MRHSILGSILTRSRHEVIEPERWETTSSPGLDLSEIVPVREDYARISIRDSFDWENGIARAPDFRAYLVVFRSVRGENADIERLIAYDDRAHGFMYYFKGDVAHDRYCLSFCLWESREHAKIAASGVYHQLAVAIAEEMYDAYDLERYNLYRSGGKLIFESVSPAFT